MFSSSGNLDIVSGDEDVSLSGRKSTGSMLKQGRQRYRERPLIFKEHQENVSPGLNFFPPATDRIGTWPLILLTCAHL